MAKNMKDIMNEEVKKISEYRRWTYHSFYYINETRNMDNEIVRLKAAGMQYEKRPVQRNYKLVGYNIFVR